LCRRLSDSGAIARGKVTCGRFWGGKIVNTLVDSKGTQDEPTRRFADKPIISPMNPVFRPGSYDPSLLYSAVDMLVDQLREGRTDIYNELSLQHELGVLLRAIHTGNSVQLERNISYFGLIDQPFEKREIDIAVFDKQSRTMDAVIELKFLRNGQYPEQMFSFCKDVVFTEQLVRAVFSEGLVVIFAEDRLFYEGDTTGIYRYFRGGRRLPGKVAKPTRKQDHLLEIVGSYEVAWKEVAGSLKYTIIEVDSR
jgi:hypothetical protein